LYPGVSRPAIRIFPSDRAPDFRGKYGYGIKLPGKIDPIRIWSPGIAEKSQHSSTFENP
jgi:hypothetical protein